MLELNLVKMRAVSSKAGIDINTGGHRRHGDPVHLLFIQFEWGSRLTLDGCCDLEWHFISTYV